MRSSPRNEDEFENASLKPFSFSVNLCWFIIYFDIR